MNMRGEGFRHDLSRIRRDLIPALKERVPAVEAPPKAEVRLSPESAKKLIDSLIETRTMERITAGLSGLESGSYRAREKAGSPEKGTRHAHDFVVDTDEIGSDLFFVDPENVMGKNKNKNPLGLPRRGDLRPKVNIVYGVGLDADGQVSHISLLRYRASAIPEDKQWLHKNSAQLDLARSMLRDGDLPGILQDQEQEITFRLDLRPAQDGFAVTAQAREASNDGAVQDMINALASGDSLAANDPLEGYLERFRAIMRTHFPKHFENQNFKSL